MGHDDAAPRAGRTLDHRTLDEGPPGDHGPDGGSITVSFFEGHAYVVMRGAVDVDTVLRHATLPPIVARDSTSVSVDLRELTFIDSSGLSFLIRLARPLLPRRVRLVHHRHTELRTLITTMSLDELFELVDD